MEASKLYCPYCNLELAASGRHKNEDQAWLLFECDYNAAYGSKLPVGELVIRQEELKRVAEQRIALKKIARKLNERISELKSCT